MGDGRARGSEAKGGGNETRHESVSEFTPGFRSELLRTTAPVTHPRKPAVENSNNVRAETKFSVFVGHP